MSATRLLAIGLLASFALSAPQLLAQATPAPSPNSAPASHLTFEVASIKVHPMAPNSFMMRRYDHAPPFVIPTGNRFTERAHLQELVMEAYGLNATEIIGLPAWALSPAGTVYDIEAKSDGDATPTPEQMEQMLQSLLGERFQLKVHRETKPNVPVYALVLGKDGPKFKEFHKDDQAPPPDPNGPRPFTGTTIYALMHSLIQLSNLDRPMIDATGLPEKIWDFDINKLMDFTEYSKERRADPLAAQDYMFSAIRDKLDLKIETQKQNMEVLIVDHVEEPSAN